MDAKAAAEQIRSEIDPHVSSKTEPDERRQFAFVQAVASHLGLDHTDHFNLRHVSEALEHHGIEAPEADQYPKWVELHQTQIDHDADGNPILPEWVKDFHKVGGKVSIIVADADEEHKAVNPVEVDPPQDELKTEDKN